MLICANCHDEIKQGEEVVYSATSNSPMHLACQSTCIKCAKPITDQESLSNQYTCTACSTGKTSEVQIDSIRRSHIELYKTCPYAFYLEVVKGIETENNVYALHGIILHEIFEEYSLHPEKNTDEMFEIFESRFKDEVPLSHFDFKEKPELYENLLEKGVRAIRGFIEYNSSIAPPWRTEEKITFSIDKDLPSVNITMDRVNQDANGDLHFIDYKCGKTFAGQKLSRDLQVPLYCLASKHAYGKLPKSFTFVFVSEGKTRYYELQGDNTYVCYVGKRKYEINITEAVREVKQIFSMIKKKQFNIPQNILAFTCNMCYYGKKSICGKADTQRWLNVNR